MQQEKCNQCSRILSHLMRYGRLDMTTARSLGIQNLAARVSELRTLGLKITTTAEGYRIEGRRVKTRHEPFEDDLFPDYKP